MNRHTAVEIESGLRFGDTTQVNEQANDLYRQLWENRNMRDKLPLLTAWGMMHFINSRVMGPKFYRLQMAWDVRFELASDDALRGMLAEQEETARAQGATFRLASVDEIMALVVFGFFLIEAGARLLVMGRLPAGESSPTAVVAWMNELVAESREALPPPTDTAARDDLFRREVVVCGGVEIGYKVFAACHEGARVTLRGLSAAELNGETGSILKAIDARTGRAKVRLDSTGSRIVAVKATNLTVTEVNTAHRSYMRALTNLAVCSGLLRFQLECVDSFDAADVDLLLKLVQENKLHQIPREVTFELVHILGVQDRPDPLEYLYMVLRQTLPSS